MAIKKRHGLFALEQTYGSLTDAEPIGWRAISFEHAFSNQAREANHLDPQVSPSVQVEITQPGIYRITYEQIIATNPFFAGTHLEDLALTRAGKPIPIRIGSDIAKSSKTFGPGWYVDFFADIEFSLYSDISVYQLIVNQKLAKRITPIANTSPFVPQLIAEHSAVVQRNQNNEYSFASQLPDPWYDTQLIALEKAESFDFQFEVSHLIANKSARLRVSGYGVTDFPQDQDHHLRFYINQKIFGRMVGRWS